MLRSDQGVVGLKKPKMSEETTFNLEMGSEQFEKEYRLGNLKFSDPEPKATVRVRPGVLSGTQLERSASLLPFPFISEARVAKPTKKYFHRY